MNKLLLILLFSLNSIHAEEDFHLEIPKIYFSPNNDGILDTLEISIEKKNPKEVQFWNLYIKDELGKLIREFQSDLRHKKKGVLSSIFRSSEKLAQREIKIPEKIEWLGVDKEGKIPRDGRYFFQFHATYSDGSTYTSQRNYFYLDTLFPESRVSPENKFFTPNGDRNSDTILIKQDWNSEFTDRFKASFINEKKIPVKTYFWEATRIPKAIIWDGKDDRGIPQKSGLYVYELVGEDFSENQFTSRVESIKLSNSIESFDIVSSNDSFSPNGDGFNDTINFKALIPSETKKIDNYRIAILDSSNKEIAFLTGAEIPGEGIIWNGKNTKGDFLDDGEYSYYGTIVSPNKTIKSEPRKFTVNNSDVKFKVKLSPEKNFTPDGDGENDILTISLKVENLPLTTWKLSIVESYSKEGKEKRKIIKQWKGYNVLPKKILWDGYTDLGTIVSSLANLEIYFSFRDSSGNHKTYFLREFETGILALYDSKERIRISIPEYICKKDESSMISKVKSILNDYPGYGVELQSHSSQAGDNALNLKKTEKRARELFQKFYSSNEGFGRFKFTGYGEIELLHQKEDEYFQEKNERIDFLLFKVKEKVEKK
ncbi:MAG: hypothetical protein SFU98_21040 [Leptospiraceae bacterium]|nr:hypothetical protein [Leptospiraceae bacterium]